MVNWRRMEQRLDRTVLGRANAEDVRHYPLNNGRADQGRPSTIYRATVADEVDKTQSAGGGMEVHISSGKTEVYFDRFRYPDLRVEEGDKLRCTDRIGQPYFLVQSVSDRATNLLTCVVSEI